nr:cytochrome c oxidase assembly factor 6 homolog isoform X2 [Cherax quadricarinatus]XP_053628194.1 cytochrome c oxidase assembly factor 6 homolog isoform X2 [Cherax quadricarinatus]
MPRETGEHSTQFPNKESRYQCWESRDKLWECLDLGGTDETCKEFRNKYVELCPGTWVKHFDRKRKYQLFKEQINQGYEPLDSQARRNEG